MPLTDEEKEQVIEYALATEQGITAIAQVMANAMANYSMGYSELGRKLLKMDETIEEEIPDIIESRFDILDL
jgi:hypothetical protein